jgi:hypothetical protein
MCQQALEAMISKSTFLTNPMWKTLPFSVEPKTPYDRLLDLLLEAPSLLTKADRLAHLPPHQLLQSAVDLIKNCSRVNWDLEKFYGELEDVPNGPLYWAVSSSLGREQGDATLFPFSYRFLDNQIASVLILYWATLTVLWSGMCHLYETIGRLTTLKPTNEGQLAGTFIVMSASEEPEYFQIPQLGRCRDFMGMALNVCQSVEFCMAEEIQARAVVAPLNMIIDALESWSGYEGEIDWAKAMLARVQPSIKIAKCLR